MSGPATPTPLNRQFMEAGLLTADNAALLERVMQTIEDFDVFEAFRQASQLPLGPGQLIIRFSDQLDPEDAITPGAAGEYRNAVNGLPPQIVLNPAEFNGGPSNFRVVNIAEVILHEYGHHTREQNRQNARAMLRDTTRPAAERAINYVNAMLDDETRARYEGYLVLREWQRTNPDDAQMIENQISRSPIWRKFAEADSSGEPTQTMEQHIQSVVVASRGVMAAYATPPGETEGFYLRSAATDVARETGLSLSTVIQGVRGQLPNVPGFRISEVIHDDGSVNLTVSYAAGAAEQYAIGSDGKLYGWELTRADGSQRIERYDEAGTVLSRSDVSIVEQSGSSTYKLIVETDLLTGQVELEAAEFASDGAKQAFRRSEIQAQNQQGYLDQAFASAANLVMSIRNGDKIGVLLNGARVTNNLALAGSVDTGVVGSLINGAEAVAGVLQGLRGLESGGFTTQLSSALLLVRSADNLYKEITNTSFLDPATTELLTQLGAVVSILGLANIDDMLENGQFGSAALTTIQAINGIAYLAGSTTTITGAAAATETGTVALAGEGAFIPMDPYVGAIIFMVVTAIQVLTDRDPPPAPPGGSARFVRRSDGSLWYALNSDCVRGGDVILNQYMTDAVAKLNQQMALANANVTDPDRRLHLVAGRMPEVRIQGLPVWSEHNYFFMLDAKHPVDGHSVLNGIAPKSFVDHFAESLVFPEAIVQGWQAEHMRRRFGDDESLWLTEGQWTARLDGIESQRKLLRDAIASTQEALATTRQTALEHRQWSGNGEFTGNVDQSYLADAASIAAAEAAANAARDAFLSFEALHPIDPQLTARIVDPSITDPAQLKAAREGAARQWLKVIALDLGGDGIQRKALPATVATDLISIQTDGVTRIDVDNDGFLEATEWVGPTDALLGIDRNGNGAIDSASELLNGVSTPFAQRGWQSLRYYDVNGDNQITAADPVFRLLRLWIDLNGDGSAGRLETFDLQMRYAGNAELLASLDAAGRAALEALSTLAVQSIDLNTYRFRLADNSTVLATEVSLQAQTQGIMIGVDKDTHNVSILHESGLRENYVTLVEDMSVLLELEDDDISPERRAQLLAVARRWGLNPDSADFFDVVRGLRAGGLNIGGTDAPIYLTSDDVWTDPNVRRRLEEMRFTFHSAQSVGSADVFGTARLGSPIAVGPGTAVPVAPAPWVEPRRVASGEVTSDPGLAPPPAPNPERWVPLAAIYNLDHVVKGAQLGGVVRQEAVIASNAAAPGTPTREMQFYTAANPQFSLAAATVQVQEDQEFQLGFAQLELEARSLIPGASPFAATRLLGVREVAHGRVEIDDANQRVRFIADANYSGGDAGFTYAVMDDQGRVMDRRIHFDVVEVNDAPILVGESVQASEDVPLLLDTATLLANDSDLEGDTLTVIGIGRVGMGRAELLSGSLILYTPPTDLYGLTDTIEYLVRDSRGATAVGTVKITLHAVADAPTVVGEVIRNAREDETLRIDPALLLANDIDTDFDRQSGAGQLRVTAVSGPEHGSAFIDASGNVIFIPEAGFNGRASFQYTVTDATGLSTTGRAEVEVGAVNDLPRAYGERIASDEDVPLVIDTDLLLANDTDPDIARGESQRLRVVAVGDAVNGTVTLQDGHVVFTPTANFSGEASFRYSIVDDSGGFAQATARIDLAPVNDLPVALNRSYTGVEDHPVSLTVAQLLAGITDPEDGAVSLNWIGSASGGTLTQSGSQILFTPGPNFNGVGRFQYRIGDSAGAESTGEVSISFNGVNDAPVFLPGSVFTKQGEEDQEARIAGAAIRRMFVDVDGDAIVIDSTTLRAVNAADTIRYDQAKDEVVFKAARNANGNRAFDVQVRDTSGALSAVQRLNVDFRSLNDSPVVNASYVWINEDGWTGPPGASQDPSSGPVTSYVLYSTLLANASDPEGDPLRIVSAGKGRLADGTPIEVRLDAAHQGVAVTPPANYVGRFFFEYEVADDKGAKTLQTAHGQVLPVNDRPTVWAVHVTTKFGFAQYQIQASDLDGTIVGYGIHAYPELAALYEGQVLNPKIAPKTLYHPSSRLPGAPSDFILDVQDGKGYNPREQFVVVKAVDSDGAMGWAC